MIDPGHDRGIRTKIGGESLDIEPDGAESVLSQVEKRAHLRLPKAINRLHRIADAEDAPSVVPLPSRRELLHQIELRRRGVLELIEQQMLQPIIEPQAQVGGRLGSPERAQRRHRDGRKIHGASFPKDAVELGRREHENLGHIAHPLPVRIVVARIRQIANGAKRCDDVLRAVATLEFLEQRVHDPFLRAGRRKAESLVDLLADIAASRQQHQRDGPPAAEVCELSAEERRMGLPRNEIRAYPGEISRRRAQARRERRQQLAAEHTLGTAELARHEKSEILIEARAHMRKLPLVHFDGRVQVSHQQRQPAVPLRQHRDDQINEGAPALIAHGEHALHGLSEIVLAIVQERAARGFLVQRPRIVDEREPPSRARDDGQLGRQPGVERIDGLDTQPRRMARQVDVEAAQMAARRDGELPGLSIQGRRAFRQTTGFEGADHAKTHFLGGAAGKGQRKNALRRVHRREQAQIALRQQRCLAAARRRLHQDRAPRLDRARAGTGIGDHDGCLSHDVATTGANGSRASSVEGTRHNP